MGESKVGFIPQVVVQGAMGPKVYGVLLTDQRFIFALESASKAGIAALLGGIVGAAIANAMATREEVDYDTAEPEALAADGKNLAIPHNAIEHLRFEKKLAAYRLILEYRNPKGKRKKLDALVTPSYEFVQERKQQGVKLKAARREYAQSVQEALRRALPLNVTQRAKWWV